jgi:hypothetical protein
VSIVSELSWWQELLLLGLALVSFLYVFYFRIWVALAMGSDLIFALALAAAIISVTTSAPFDRASFELVERSALPEALVSADERVAAIEAMPGEMIDRALAHLGVEPTPEPVLLEPLGPGPFESRIRPSVEALVSVVLRALSFFCASLLLLIGLSLRSSTSTARALQAVSARADALERRLAEATRASPSTTSTPPAPASPPSPPTSGAR